MYIDEITLLFANLTEKSDNIGVDTVTISLK